MARLTTNVGIVLIIVGIAGYFATGMASVTALIPAFFGAAFFVLGRLALREARRKMAMHIAVVVALLGAAGSFRGLSGLFGALSTGVPPSTAQWLQTVMFLLCLGLLIAGIRSFVAARKG